MGSNCLVNCTCLVSWKDIVALPLRSFPYPLWNMFARARGIFNKSLESREDIIFSIKCPRSINTAGNAWMVIAWPRHYELIVRAARSPTIKLIKFTKLRSVKFLIFLIYHEIRNGSETWTSRRSAGDESRASKWHAISKWYKYHDSTSYEPIDPEGTQNKKYGPSCTNMNGMNPTRNLEICRTYNSKGFGKTDYIGKGKQ